MTLKAVDVNGNGVPNVWVEQSWRHYSFESSGNEEKLQTDEQGNVTFSEKTKRVFLVRILLDQVLEKININPHASSGPYASFLVDGYNSRAVRYKPTEEIPTQIILTRKFEQ